MRMKKIHSITGNGTTNVNLDDLATPGLPHNEAILLFQPTADASAAGTVTLQMDDVGDGSGSFTTAKDIEGDNVVMTGPASKMAAVRVTSHLRFVTASLAAGSVNVYALMH